MFRAPVTLCLAILAAQWGQSQGLTPRAKPSDYPAQAAIDKNFTLAAEDLLYTVPTVKGALVANDYLLIEVAVFGPVKEHIHLSTGNFTLVIAGAKNVTSTVHADPPGAVAQSIKYSGSTPKRPNLSGGAEIPGVIGVGSRPQVERFPGDPSVRAPYPSPVPPAENPAGIEKEQPMSNEERIQRAALAQGDCVPAVAGLLYFPFTGKTKSIKSLELVYEGTAGKVTLKLD